MITPEAIAQAFTLGDWFALRPLIIVAATALVILVCDIIAGKRGLSRLLTIVIGCCGLILAGIDVLAQFRVPFAAFGGAFFADGLAVVFQGIIILATLLSLLLFYAFEKRTGAAGAAALMLWSACGALLMAGAGNLLTIFLGLELLSLGLYALCALAQRATAREAALKYFILSSLASAVMLYGMALLYGCTGSVALSAILSAPPGSMPLHTIAMGLFFIGVAFKLGLAPFHIWMPDVFEGAPLPVTAFMSVVTKAGMLAVLARITYTAVPSAYMHELLLPLWCIAGLSMLIGNFGALAQTNVKRLLAYSGIAQIGYVVAAFAGGTAYGLRYGMFYLAAYLFMNLGAFAVIALLSDENDEGARLVSYAGLGRTRPVLAAAMSFFLIGLAGLPPTAGFLGKILLLSSAVNAGYTWLAALLIIGTAISIYAYFKIIRMMYAPTRRDGVSAGVVAATVAPMPWVAVAVCAVAVFAFGLYPAWPSAVLPMIK